MSAHWTMFGEMRFFHPGIVRDARRWAVGKSRDRAAWVDPDDLELVVSELVTNALRHSASGYNDGGVDVRLFVDPAARVMRLVVVDDGHAATKPEIPVRSWGIGDATSGRGLLIVKNLVRDMGFTIASARDRFCLLWVEM
ncbi:ATP-binding protein [Actinomadura atramentaria]|uniref:ATP-binding protein n=1 Tax=Actinomadura atramentaria TaxID=1990 RepID=UPI00039A1B07|nr:ATP-binding protein [Actinomadura atramentaria]